MSRLKQRIENFNNAFILFEKIRNEYIKDKTNDALRLALAQAFEILFELSWKILKDYMYENGIEANYPKEVIKEAFNKNTIKNGQIWIDMLNTRNSTSHEYNMDKIDLLLENIAYSFYEELNSFSNIIKGF